MPNTQLDSSEAEPYIGPAAIVMGSVNLLDAVRKVTKPTCGPDDQSNEGPWSHTLAVLVDGTDQRVLRAAGTRNDGWSA